MYLDSNIFIFAILDEGKLGDDCREIMRRIRSRSSVFAASFLVVDEVIWILKKDIGKNDAIKVAKSILSLPINWIPIHHRVMIRMVDNHERTSLDPRDALHLSSMQENGISVIVSYDKDFDRIEGIERLTASEYVRKFEAS